MKAFAKINLALVVGPGRPDGKHEVATVLQAIDFHDDVVVEPYDGLVVEGFAGDTLVRDALLALSAAAGLEPSWCASLVKRIPVAAGLGGGSSDAAAALTLANAQLVEPLSDAALHDIAAALGADVPFFLSPGTCVGTGDGTTLEPIELPLDFAVLVVLRANETKSSTADVYRAFDARGGAVGFDRRRAALREVLGRIRTPSDLADLPLNDLSRSALATELERLGAFRADVCGAGPAVYGLFEDAERAEAAAAALPTADRSWIARPVAAERPVGNGKIRR